MSASARIKNVIYINEQMERACGRCEYSVRPCGLEYVLGVRD